MVQITDISQCFENSKPESISNPSIQYSREESCASNVKSAPDEILFATGRHAYAANMHLSKRKIPRCKMQFRRDFCLCRCSTLKRNSKIRERMRALKLHWDWNSSLLNIALFLHWSVKGTKYGLASQINSKCASSYLCLNNSCATDIRGVLEAIKSQTIDKNEQ